MNYRLLWRLLRERRRPTPSLQNLPDYIQPEKGSGVYVKQKSGSSRGSHQVGLGLRPEDRELAFRICPHSKRIPIGRARNATRVSCVMEKMEILEEEQRIQQEKGELSRKRLMNQRTISLKITTKLHLKYLNWASGIQNCETMKYDRDGCTLLYLQLYSKRLFCGLV